MSKPKDFYWSEEFQRTIQEMQELSMKTNGEKYGFIHPPLIRICLRNIVPDELHLFLRVTGIVSINVFDMWCSFQYVGSHPQR